MSRRLRGSDGAVFAHLGSLVVGAVILIGVNRNQWFFGDEWDFLGGYRTTWSWPDQLLIPHNEHWGASPLLVFRGIELLVGLRTYWPYALAAIVVHLVIVHLLWRIIIQGGLTPWAATIGVLPAIALGAGAENLLWGFQVGFLGSLALGSVLRCSSIIPDRGRLVTRLPFSFVCSG